MKRVLLTLIFLLLCVPAYAANHYIREGASGSADGSDWTNAWTDLPATLTRGDTYYIADGTYGGYTFDDAESGELYIYIYKATELAHGTETGWDSEYGDGQALFTGSDRDYLISFNQSYFVFSGVAASDPSDSSTYGFKLKNLSTDYVYGVGLPHTGQRTSSPQYVTVSYCAIVSPGEEMWDAGSYNVMCGILMNDAADAEYNTISHCYFAGGSMCIHAPQSKNNIFEYNYFDGNFSRGSAHGQMILLPNTDGGTHIRNNVFYHPRVFCVSGIDSDGGTSGVHTYLYNNLIVGDGTAINSVFGNADSGYPDVILGWIACHNTVVNMDVARSFLFTGTVTDTSVDKSYAYNNLFINFTDVNLSAATIDYDYNAYYDCDGTYTPGANGVLLDYDPTNQGSPDYDLAYAVPVFPTADLNSLVGLNITVDIQDTTRDATPDAGAFELEAGGSAPEGVTEWTAIADSNQTDGENDLDYIVANADSDDIITLGAGIFKGDDYNFTSGDINFLLEANATVEIQNKKTITGFTAKQAGGAAGTDTVKVASGAEDYMLSYDEVPDSTLNTTSTTIAFGYRSASTSYYNAGYTFHVPKTMLASADSVVFWTMVAVDESDFAKGHIMLQNTASATAPTTVNEMAIAIADSLPGGAIDHDFSSADDDGEVKTKNITSLTDSIPDMDDYASTGDTLDINLFVLEDGETSTYRGIVSSFEASSAAEVARLLIYSSGGAGTGENAFKVLTGEETNPSYVWFDGDLGTQVEAWKDSLLENEWFYSATGDTLYVPDLQTSDTIEIDGYDTLIDFGGNAGITINGLTGTIIIKAFGAIGVDADAAGTIQYIWFDSTRTAINAGVTQTLIDHITIDGSAIAADSLFLVDSPITNSIIETVAVVDTTGGYGGSYNDWNASGDQPAGTGDITTDLELDSDAIPTVSTWAANGDYFGYAYYAAGTVTITAPDSTGVYDYGDSVYIKWESAGIDSLKFQYSLTGDYFTDIETVAASDDSLLWVVPRQHSETMVIYGESTVSSLVNDTSDEFTVNADYSDSAIVAINDGYVRNLDTTYLTARNVDSDLYSDDNYMFVGRTTGYRIRRAFASFPIAVQDDTLRITMLSSNDYSNAAAPSNNEYVGFYASSWNGYEPYLSINYVDSVAVACTLWVYHAGNYSTTDFNVYLVESTYGDEVDTDDFNAFSGWGASGAYTGAILNETWNTSGWINGRMSIIFNTNGLNVINGIHPKLYHLMPRTTIIESDEPKTYELGL